MACALSLESGTPVRSLRGLKDVLLPSKVSRLRLVEGGDDLP